MKTTVVVFEDSGFRRLLPLVYWRPGCQLRCGRRSLLKKIRRQLHVDRPVLYVRSELAEVVAEQTGLPVNALPDRLAEPVLFVNGRWLADTPLPEIPVGSCLVKHDAVVAAHLAPALAGQVSPNSFLENDLRKSLPAEIRRISADQTLKLIQYPWDLVSYNPGELVRECRDSDQASPVSPAVHLVCPENIHIGRAVIIKPGVVIDAENGPVWIDDEVTIQPNAVIQGPCCIGAKSLVQISAIVREDTSIGPVCKVGGELESSIMQGYSNKQHYGFMGHSYIGAWVNIGAGATGSDLKNTYGPIKVSLDGREVIDTGVIFAGLICGDHTKAGINVCFPTGGVVGTASCVIMTRYVPRFVPSFSWVTDDAFADYDPDQAVKVAERAMSRRKVTLTAAQRALFQAMPQITRRYEQRPQVDGS